MEKPFEFSVILKYFIDAPLTHSLHKTSNLLNKYMQNVSWKDLKQTANSLLQMVEKMLPMNNESQSEFKRLRHGMKETRVN